MRRPALVLSALLLAGLSAAAVARADAPDRTIDGTVVAEPAAGQQIGLRNVRVKCLGTDRSVHDDVQAPLTDPAGKFSLQVPARYQTFRLWFVDQNSSYWPKEMELSPSRDPWSLGSVVLKPQSIALTTSERAEVVAIQLALARSDAALAAALLASLRNFEPAIELASIAGKGTGSASPYFARWSEAYRQQRGVALDFQASDAGAAVVSVQAGTADFVSLDFPLDRIQLLKLGLVQLPIGLNGVVPVINLEGVQNEQLKLDGATLADIFLGKVARWNDPEITRLNPGLHLPDQPIRVVHRSDDSGANRVLTRYLSRSSSSWKVAVGEGTSVSWPAGVGAEGNEGVGASVAGTAGAVGYVDYAYAMRSALTYPKLKNDAGAFVAPTAAALQAASPSEEGPLWFHLRTSRWDAWPITGEQVVVMSKWQTRPGARARVLDFVDWVFKKGDSAATELGYVPLSPAAKVEVSLAVESHKNSG